MSLSVSGSSQQSALFQLLRADIADQTRAASPSDSGSSSSSVSATSATDSSSAISIASSLINIMAQLNLGGASSANASGESYGGSPAAPPPVPRTSSASSSSDDSLVTQLHVDLTKLSSDIGATGASSSTSATSASSNRAGAGLTQLTTDLESFLSDL